MKLKQIWIFGYKDKKAFIFTMDVAVALIVVFSLLFTASFFVVRKAEDPFVNLQTLKIGSDIIKIIDYTSLLDNPDGTEITNFIENNLPAQYGMQIIGSSEGSCYFEAGSDPLPSGRISSGKEFYSVGNEYCSMRYKVWLK
jgi:hypothetical protein